MKWHQKISAGLLSSFLFLAPLAAQADEIRLQPEEKTQFTQLAQLDRRSGETLRELKRDPAKAFLLSLLYPGLGQLYVGNDDQRSYAVMGAGTVVVVGSLVGFGLLADRPPEASTLGYLMIIFTLAGYHLWNVRDAYVQAEGYNKMLEKENLVSFLDQFQLSYSGDTVSLSWHLPL